MSTFVESRVVFDDAVASVCSLFDYQSEGVVRTEIPTVPAIPKDFSLGLIVGPSGTGKSKLLQQIEMLGYGDTAPAPRWDASKAVVSHFADAGEAVDRLGAAGLNSVPSWVKPYHVLSNGEQHRADMARVLGNKTLIDEFTSVVDRVVAKSLSVALRRFIDAKGLKGVVLATCHYDVLEWLEPDWIFDTATGSLSVGRSLRRPAIQLEVLPCTAEAWRMFRPHHYLDGNLNRSSRQWIAVWEGTVVGFAAALAFPNANFKNAWREHRTVVLPDFQGLGLGVRLSDAVAEMFVSQGCRYFSKTAHPRMGWYRDHSPLWKPTSKNGKARPDYKASRNTKEDGHKMKHVGRVCFSHEYVGAN